MLGLGFDVSIDIKKAHMPIYFDRKNECVHCGAINSLIFMDKLGREVTKEINPFTHIKCKNCGRTYSIQWTKEEGSNKMYPSAVEPNIMIAFNNFINNGNIRAYGSTEFR